MRLHTVFRIATGVALCLVLACLTLFAANGLLYLFNHPRFPGEATGALALLLLLLTLMVCLASALLRRLFETPIRPRV